MSKQLIMTKGLPGSGKSTWAKAKVAESYADGYRGPKFKRLNKDLLRETLDFGHWSRDNEKFVLGVRDMLVVKALTEGHSVIVDDTGFGAKHEPRLRDLAVSNGAIFEIQDFTNVSIETCIERDLKRLNSVGEAVIRKMWRDYLAPKPPVIEYNPRLPNCIICDIDGTVAIMNGRSPYDYSMVHTDIPNKPVVAVIHSLAERYQIFFVSGRKAECRDATAMWLLNHVGYNTPLFMRGDGDNRDVRIVKQEIYEKYIKPNFNVVCVIDDRKRVVERWRELGLTCLQVAEGDF